MNPPKPRFNASQRAWIRQWWRALQPRMPDDPPPPDGLYGLGRGARAQLRRCKKAEDLLAQPAFFALARPLIARSDGHLADAPITYERLAWVAAVLACVNADLRDGRSLALHLGQAPKGGRVAMSELRFKTMLRCTSVPDLCTHWRRALALVDCKADVARLADDILAWQMDLHHRPQRASDGIRFHWASDYYPLGEKSQDDAPPFSSPASPEENHP